MRITAMSEASWHVANCLIFGMYSWHMRKLAIMATVHRWFFELVGWRAWQISRQRYCGDAW